MQVALSKKTIAKRDKLLAKIGELKAAATSVVGGAASQLSATLTVVLSQFKQLERLNGEVRKLSESLVDGVLSEVGNDDPAQVPGIEDFYYLIEEVHFDAESADESSLAMAREAVEELKSLYNNYIDALDEAWEALGNVPTIIEMPDDEED